METVYLIVLVVAGGVALLSAFGDFLDVGVDGDAALGLDLDFDLDADTAFTDLADAGPAASTAPPAAIFSLRALVFAAFGFGATGTALSAFGARPAALSTVALSLLAGLVVGVAVGGLLAYLKRSDTHSRPGDEGFRGLTGRVVLPIREGTPGTVIVRRGPREHSVRALPHSAARGDPEGWTRVVVVEMRSGIALVGPLEPEDRELLD